MREGQKRGGGWGKWRAGERGKMGEGEGDGRTGKTRGERVRR